MKYQTNGNGIEIKSKNLKKIIYVRVRTKPTFRVKN